jgi:hypothetical protein
VAVREFEYRNRHRDTEAQRAQREKIVEAAEFLLNLPSVVSVVSVLAAGTELPDGLTNVRANVPSGVGRN